MGPVSYSVALHKSKKAWKGKTRQLIGPIGKLEENEAMWPIKLEHL
jgi:hypothetical protein